MSQLLIGAATALGGRIMPELPEGSYATGDAKMLAVMLVLLAQDVDRAADRLASENAGMRSLFAAATAHPLDLALKTRLADLATTTDASLVVGALEATHDILSEALIALHAALETVEAAWAKEMNVRIWQFLQSSAESRAVVLPSLA
jgi:hypothetical protein